LSACQRQHVAGDGSRVRVWRNIFRVRLASLWHFFRPDRIASAQSAELGRHLYSDSEGKVGGSRAAAASIPVEAAATPPKPTIFWEQSISAKDALSKQRTCCKKLSLARPLLVEPRLSLGDAYLAEGKFESALTAYQGAAKIAPHDVRANLALAKLYLGTGEFAKSIEAAGNIPPEKRTAELLPTLAADYFGAAAAGKSRRRNSEPCCR